MRVSLFSCVCIRVKGVKVAAIFLAVCGSGVLCCVCVCLAGRSSVVLAFRQTGKAAAACGLKAGDLLLFSHTHIHTRTHKETHLHTTWAVAK